MGIGEIFPSTDIRLGLPFGFSKIKPRNFFALKNISGYFADTI